MTSGTVYGLHSGDGRVWYVGQTRQDPRRRLWAHRHEAKHPRYNLELHAKIAEGVEMLILYTGAKYDAMESEWIGRLRPEFNRSSGGSSGFAWSEVALERRSRALEGNPNLSHAGESNSFYGRKHSPEFIASISGSGNPMAKLSEADVAEIRRRRGEGEKQIALSREFGVGPMQISRIVRGLRWSESRTQS